MTFLSHDVEVRWIVVFAAVVFVIGLAASAIAWSAAWCSRMPASVTAFRKPRDSAFWSPARISAIAQGRFTAVGREALWWPPAKVSRE